MTFRKTLGVPILLNTCEKLLIKLHIWHYKQSKQLANSRLSKPRLEEGPTPRLMWIFFCEQELLKDPRGFIILGVLSTSPVRKPKQDFENPIH